MEHFFEILIHVINILTYTHVSSRDLPEEVYTLCPYSDICNKTASSTLNSDGNIPCCSSCSCDESCGLRLDCCFDYLDKYRLVEKGIVACVGTHYTYDGKNTAETNQNVNFHMVISCADESGGKSSSKSCRLQDENGHSLLSPVSDRETSTIYINKECALCNNINISRLQQWLYLYVPETEIKDSSITFLFENNIENAMGTIVFMPPFDEDWSHTRCYNTYFEVNHCLYASKEWQALCQDFHAPYQHNFRSQLFRNIFCAVCHGLATNIGAVCKMDTNRRFSSKITLLLKTTMTETLELYNLATTTNVAYTKHSCPQGYVNYVKDTCLRVYCQEGMLTTPDGCVHVARRWFPAVIVMQLKLLPQRGTILPVSVLPLKDSREQANPVLWMKIPCRQVGLTSVEVYAPSADQTDHRQVNRDYVTSFIVRLWKKVDGTYGIDPSVAMPLFQNCVRRNWIVNLENRTYTFKPYFDKYSMYIQDGFQMLVKFPRTPLTTFRETIPRPALYKRISEGPVKEINLVPLVHIGIRLKKPFFCKQLRVPAYDVSVEFGEIRILSKNITLGSNEYIANEPGKNGDNGFRDTNRTTFSVCLEDLDFSFSDISGAGIRANSATDTTIFMLILYIGYPPFLLFT